MSEPQPLTRRQVFDLAWPMVFANAALPLAGVTDTFVIGLVGGAVDLGGVALGATLFNVFYWSFYFFRMSTTGLATQADGAGQHAESQRILLRALGAATIIGLLLLALRIPASSIGFAILQGDADVEALGATYFLVRSWGAVGVFTSFALTGWLIGLGRTRAVLIVSVALSATNIALDLWFVLGLGWGVAGVAAATAIAEMFAAILAGAFALDAIRARGGFAPEALAWSSLLDPRAARRLFAVNADLMVRTWSLILGFSWFANVGARLGTSVLAGNHVLLQIVSLWAFVLDAYAFVAETEVGRAVGARSVPRLRRAIRLTTEFALGSGFVFMIVTLAFGPAALNAWIADPDARATALTFLTYCAVIPLIGAMAWQLDGVFVGATRSRAMRNAAVIAVLMYLALNEALMSGLGLGAHGAWLAFLGYYIARAATLGAAYPGLERSLGTPRPSA
jgi:MATE family multidrug resistance protein